jgi:hypothetical protein
VFDVMGNVENMLSPLVQRVSLQVPEMASALGVNEMTSA